MKKLVSLIICVVAICGCRKEPPPIPLNDDTFFTILDEREDVRLERELEDMWFTKKGLFWFTQPIDAQHPELGSYEQRVVVAHRDFSYPTLFLIDGYDLYDGYINSDMIMHELEHALELNVVYVEHRYYGKSLNPKDKEFKYLTFKNAADDYHNIYEIMSQYYSQNWASTGGSKGGEAAMYYQMFYPEDMTVAVPYVAPIFEVQADHRVYPYIRANIGTPESRKELDDYIVEMLERREEIKPIFQQQLNEVSHLKFHFNIDELYDVLLIDFSISRWQYGSKLQIESLPSGADPFTMLEPILTTNIDGFSYNSQDHFSSPYNVQCAKELGIPFYGFDPYIKDRIEGLTVYQPVEAFAATYLLPDGAVANWQGTEIAQRVKNFYLNNDPNVIFVYGKQDPLTVAGLTDEAYFAGKKNMHLLIHPDYDHEVSIRNFPNHNEIYDLLIDLIWNSSAN